MKRCPQCHRIESDDTLVFCRVDGAALVSDSASPDSETGTARLGATPAATEIETSLLPHATDAGMNRATAPTTVLPVQQTALPTHALSKPKRRKTSIAIAIIVTAVVAA